MKRIANILTNKPFDDSELYNVTGDSDSLIEDVPTLIVGWEYTKKVRPDANILTWEIDKDTYWTFGKRERRNRYEDCVKKFRELAVIRLIKSVKYRYINLLTSDEDEKKAYMAMIREGKPMYVYIYNNMVYVYDKDTMEVTGISLRDISYMGKNPKGILSEIYRGGNMIVDAKDELSWETKSALRGHAYVYPCLLSD